MTAPHVTFDFGGAKCRLTVVEARDLRDRITAAIDVLRVKCPTCRCMIVPGDTCRCCVGGNLPDFDELEAPRASDR